MISERVKIWGGQTARWSILGTLTIFLAFPFVWMLITAFKRTSDLYDLKHNPFLSLRTADPRAHPSPVLRNPVRRMASQHRPRGRSGGASSRWSSPSPPATPWRGSRDSGERSWASASS